ncbi:MAG TPA: hypothetical protein VMI31_15565 [Fimbriimonadaceae bacterium]|nr:hypothetical protein [Fimbriimonadaceae bacterium]
MHYVSKYAASALLAALAAVAHGQVVAKGGAYLFRAKYFTGRTASYAVRSEADVMSSKMSMTMHLSEKVLGVSHGIGTIRITTGKSDILINGKPLGASSPADEKAGQILDEKAGQIRLNDLGVAVDGSGASLQTHLELPPQALRPGQSWTTTGVAMLPGRTQEQKVSVTYRFIGFSNLGGTRVVKLGVKMNGSGVAGVTGSGAAYIRADDCSLVRETEKLNIAIQGMHIPSTLDIYRK